MMRRRVINQEQKNKEVEERGKADWGEKRIKKES
jgi:hypothetical protein